MFDYISVKNPDYSEEKKIEADKKRIPYLSHF